MTFREDAKPLVKFILRGLINNDLEFCFNPAQEGFFYPGKIPISESKMKNLLNLLSEDQYLSQIHSIRNLKGNRKEKRIDQLAEVLLEEDLFPSFDSKKIRLDFEIDSENSAKMKTVSLRYRPGSGSISANSIMEIESIETEAKVSSSTISANSSIDSKGEIL